MGTLGFYLREAREARGLDLRDAAQQTRISINYLKAIEEEDFSKLPGEVFVKGFLKNYAQFLMLPMDEVLRRFSELRSAAAPGQTNASGVPARSEQQPGGAREEGGGGEKGLRKSRTDLEPFIWGGVAIIAVAAIILAVMGGKKEMTEHALPASSNPTSTAEVVSTTAGSAVPEKLYLEIEALEDTWVLVRTDASPQKKAILRKGERVTWSADARFLLSYGSVASAMLHLNGRELSVAGPPQSVVRDLMITSAGIVQQKVESEQKPRRPKPATTSTATISAPSGQHAPAVSVPPEPHTPAAPAAPAQHAPAAPAAPAQHAPATPPALHPAPLPATGSTPTGTVR